MVATCIISFNPHNPQEIGIIILVLQMRKLKTVVTFQRKYLYPALCLDKPVLFNIILKIFTDTKGSSLFKCSFFESTITRLFREAKVIVT